MRRQFEMIAVMSTPRSARGSQQVFLAVLLVLSVMLGTACRRTQAADATVASTNLANGIRVVSVYFPGSTNVSIFTFSPMGLSTDGPGQAQWSHLVEHLVIRSTVPTDSPVANAETLPDHMRLDFYGSTANWQEGLSHHRRWLEGVPFTETGLSAEKPRVIAECDFTARNFATHKFAVAAWSHGFRHGAKQVAIKDDVAKAALTDVQRFRDERLAVSNRITLCVAGGVEAKAVFTEVEKQIGALLLTGKPAPASKFAWTNLDLTWDLDARHLLLTWRIPDFRQPEHAALMMAAQWLTMQLAMDQDLKSQTGMAFAGADLATPEGNFFFASASLRLGTQVESVQAAILKKIESLATKEIPQATMIGRQLAINLTEVPDPRSLKSQVPPGMSPAMLEGNLGLQMGLHEHRYAGHKSELAKALREVMPRKVQEAARTYLTIEKAAVCSLRPVGP
jgi:predicted Zn-dependent peptidase